MNYLVVDGSMVVSGKKEDGVLLYTPITPQTQPMLMATKKEAQIIAERSGSRAAVWREGDYANGAGVVSAGPKQGEVRVDPDRRVCINPHASYGGGSGTLWAFEGREAQLTTEDYPYGYIRGKCEKIFDDGMSISFLITHIYEEIDPYRCGATLQLPITKIRRYDCAWF